MSPSRPPKKPVVRAQTDEGRVLPAAPKRSKYGNTWVTIDGRKFQSQAEGRRYETLKRMAEDGLIDKLEMQPRYPVVVEGAKITTYVADFRYRLVDTGETVVEDVKGASKAIYRLKKKLVEALYKIEVVEVKPRDC